MAAMLAKNLDYFKALLDASCPLNIMQSCNESSVLERGDERQHALLILELEELRVRCHDLQEQQNTLEAELDEEKERVRFWQDVAQRAAPTIAVEPLASSQAPVELPHQRRVSSPVRPESAARFLQTYGDFTCFDEDDALDEVDVLNAPAVFAPSVPMSPSLDTVLPGDDVPVKYDITFLRNMFHSMDTELEAAYAQVR